MSRRRWLGCAVLAVVVLLLSIAYGRHQYGARERAATPLRDDLPGRLLEDPSFDLVLWLPYPHQNVAVLREALGGEEGAREWLAAVLRLAEVRPGTEGEISLPGFGPFPLPPARELALAIGRSRGDRAGERDRTMVAARMYPSLAWIGRAAGAVAGNPWLAGGEVRAFGGPARVSWDGTVWRIAGGGVDLGVMDPEVPAPVEGASIPEPALARLRIGPGVGSRDLPAGGYRLVRSGEAAADLELTREEPRPGDGQTRDIAPDIAEPDPFEALAPRLAAAGVAAAWAQGRDAGGAGSGRTGFAVLIHGGGRRGLPPAAVLAPASDGSRRLRLIHERLPSFLRDDLERAPAGPWLALATDAEALTAVRELAEWLPPPEALPDRFLWVDLPALRGFVAAVVDLMEEVPLFPRRELRRWRDLRTALAPLEGFGQLTLLSRPERLPQPLWRLHLRREPRH